MSNNPLEIIIRMIIIIGILLMLAYDKFPKDNEYLTEKQFLIGLAIIVFLYYFAELARGPQREEFQADEVLEFR